MILPDPIIREHEGFLVVRDDLLPGGTKRRALHVLMDDHEEYVYASPVYGYAQIALAYTCRDHGKKATIFCAKRNVRHLRTLEAQALGAQIYEVPAGYLNVVKARAREHAHYHSAKMIPFGCDDFLVMTKLALIAQALPVTPKEVWTVCGSGVLTRALQLAWPRATFYGVRVGAEPDAGAVAMLYRSLHAFEDAAAEPPPFPSVPNYDAKVWTFIKKYGAPGALMWNVA